MSNPADIEINKKAGKYIPPQLRNAARQNPTILDQIRKNQPVTLSDNKKPESERQSKFNSSRFDGLVRRQESGKFSSYESGGRHYYNGLPEDVNIILQSYTAHSTDTASLWHIPKSIEDVEGLIFGPKIVVGCDFSLYDDIPINCEVPPYLGQVPGKIQSFDNIDLPPEILYNIHRMGAEKPTPIQQYTIPICGSGIDVMASAPTGSGKTAAFLIPTITLLKLDSGVRIPRRGMSSRVVTPRCLILSPTRELAQQIHTDALRLCWRTKLYPQCIHGGAGVNGQKQIKLLRDGCDILVATPGRLIDLLSQGIISLEYVTYLILDEADKMLEMGFEEQVRSIVTQFGMPGKHVLEKTDDGSVIDYVDPRYPNELHRQTLLFSATFPKDIIRLAEDLLASIIIDDQEYCSFASIKMGSTDGTSLSSIIQSVIQVTGSSSLEQDNRKVELLLDCIHSAEYEVNEKTPGAMTEELGELCPPKFLVFVETKKRCRELENFLLEEQIECFSIHGDKEQAERDRALTAYKNFNGKSKFLRKGKDHIYACVMIATDVAQRGLHVSDITHVVNFDSPRDIADYVHRVGRTGRVGHRGFAFTYLTPENHAIFRPILDFLEKSDQILPDWLKEACRSDFHGPRGNMRGRGRFYK